MATSVALQLEKQFSTIPGAEHHQLDQHAGQHLADAGFDEGRNIDAAAVDVQRQRCCARSARCRGHDQPAELPQGQPGCAGAADRADLAGAGAAELNDYAEHLISPSLSTLDGVALV